jgi:hypothetical protein
MDCIVRKAPANIGSGVVESRCGLAHLGLAWTSFYPQERDQ